MKKKYLSLLLAASCTVFVGQDAAATPNLVLNGDFESVTGIPASAPAGVQFNYGGVTMANWTSRGNDPTLIPVGQTDYAAYNLVFSATNADLLVSGQDGLAIWGPKNGSANDYTASPTGGYFVGGDAHEYPGPIAQTIHFLTVGKSYTLSFDWAVGQQYGYDGVLGEAGWSVSFGSQTQSAGALIDDHGFSKWVHQTYSFTASAADQVLAFAAYGGGSPTFPLLDGVQLTEAVSAVPEPESWALVLTGLGLMGVLKRRNSSKKA